MTWDRGAFASLSGVAFVCDPLARGHYLIEEVAYGDRDPGPSEVHEHERTFYAGHLDYVFVAPPESIRTEHGGAIRRVLRREASK